MDRPIVFYRADKPKKNSWVKYLVSNTMTKNNNNLISVVGKTGSGKTWSAISVACMMAEQDGVPFTIDHIVFSLTELMQLINSGTLVRGSKIVFDEPQISISAREFQREANKVFNYLLSTFRHRNLTLFFCTPFESLLDKNTRKLFKFRFNTEKINKKTKTCRVKAYALEYVDYKEDPYKQRLVVNTLKGSSMVDFWDIPKPPEDIIKLYEEKKLRFTTNLNKKITERLAKYDESGKSMTSEAVPSVEYKKLTPREELVYNMNVKGFTNTKIAEFLKISIPRVTQLLQQAQNKINPANFNQNPIEIALLSLKEPILAPL
jgi:DNA-binding CsgD family transcriptional regulator